MKKLLLALALALPGSASAAHQYNLCLLDTPQFGGWLALGSESIMPTEQSCSQWMPTYSAQGYYYGPSLAIGADVPFYGSRQCYPGDGGSPVSVATWAECEDLHGFMSGGGSDGVFIPLTELTAVIPGGGLAIRPPGSEGTGGGPPPPPPPSGGGVFGVTLTGILTDLGAVGMLVIGAAVFLAGWAYVNRAVGPAASRG